MNGWLMAKGARNRQRSGRTIEHTTPTTPWSDSVAGDEASLALFENSCLSYTESTLEFPG
jgi:hypothetical protein